MSGLPVAHLRVADQPPPVTPRPVLRGGIKQMVYNRFIGRVVRGADISTDGSAVDAEIRIIDSANVLNVDSPCSVWINANFAFLPQQYDAGYTAIRMSVGVVDTNGQMVRRAYIQQFLGSTLYSGASWTGITTLPIGQYRIELIATQPLMDARSEFQADLYYQALVVPSIDLEMMQGTVS